MQDLTFFLQKNAFNIKRITKNYNTKYLILNSTNANFILESKSKIDNKQLQNLISFLNQYTSINGIFFKNQILNVERIASLKEQPHFNFWKQINNSLI